METSGVGLREIESDMIGNGVILSETSEQNFFNHDFFGESRFIRSKFLFQWFETDGCLETHSILYTYLYVSLMAK
jgi:hypothetical protein